MQTQNESSSLVALRELRESDKRRQREAEQAKAQQDRLAAAAARAREERLAREDAERQAALASERAQSARLERELAAARADAASLRTELERVNRAPAQVAAPPANRARTAGWLGLSAGATMLVGALALAAAMQPGSRPAPLADGMPRPAVACPEPAPALPPAIASHPAPPAASIAAVPGKRPRPPLPSRPQGKPSAKIVCDGTDPLCGIDPKLNDDLGKKRGKR